MNETPPVRFSQDTPRNLHKPSGKLTPFRSRRFTPYQKTPKSRKVKGSAPQLRSPQVQSRDTICKDIVNQTWRVYRCSPLYKFSHNPADIKAYARLLSAYLEAENHKGVAVSCQQDVADKANISIIKGLKGLCDTGPDAVQIVLKKKIASGKKQGEAQIVLTAIMCCVANDSDAFASVNNSFTVLPLMLVKGPVALSRTLHSWLMMTFDCVISDVTFTPIQLSWSLALWAGEVAEKNAKKIQLLYETPKHIEGINRILLEIDPKDCQRAWNGVHDPETQEVLEEEVQLFIKALEAHFYHHFQITLSAMPMMRVGTSIVCISAEGKLKIFSGKHVGQVLAHLTDLVLEQRLSPSLNTLA